MPAKFIRFKKGDRIYSLVVEGYAGFHTPPRRKNKRKIHHYFCECDCGNKLIVCQDHLVTAIKDAAGQLGKRACPACTKKMLAKLKMERKAEERMINYATPGVIELLFFNKHWTFCRIGGKNTDPSFMEYRDGVRKSKSTGAADSCRLKLYV